MNHQFKHVSWRLLGIVLLGLSLVGAAAFSVSARTPSAQASTGRHLTIKPAGAVKLVKSASVDWSKLPVATGRAPASLRNIPTSLDRMTTAQRQAYDNAMKRGAIKTPLVKGVPLVGKTATKPTVPGPNFDACGYNDAPCLAYSYAGLTSAQSGGWYPPDQAIASNPSYVLEGVNNEFVAYNFAGGVVTGPIYSFTFFSAVVNSGDSLGDPQMFWDASRLHWIIMELEIGTDASGNTIGYYDVAVSKTQNVTLNPATQYYLYQFGVNFNVGGSANWCDYPTMGGDYWGIWLDCVAFSSAGSSFLGNAVIGLSKNALYTGGFSGFAWTQIPAPNGSPAYRLSSANEDGTPDAEFLLATDAGLGPSNDTGLTTCAWTNTRGLATGTPPIASCVINTNLPVGYNDPVGAAQPGTSVLLYPGYGTKQIEYKGGNLYFALTTAINSGSSDGVYWAEVQPQLSALDPSNPGGQTVQNTIVRQASIFAYNGAYSFMGTLAASSEDDITLALNYSATTIYPSIAYMGRRATDPPGAIAINGVTAAAAFGSNPNGSGRWGDYSACSLDTNLTSRGLIWCGGEYGGPDASASGAGWDTWIYGLRVE